MSQLIECIPNFSEARRPEVVDQIVAAIESVAGARLLDRSSDLDHNRTVLTFAGPLEAVEEAAFRAIQTAAELIDLDAHGRTSAHRRGRRGTLRPFERRDAFLWLTCRGLFLVNKLVLFLRTLCWAAVSQIHIV